MILVVLGKAMVMVMVVAKEANMANAGIASVPGELIIMATAEIVSVRIFISTFFQFYIY